MITLIEVDIRSDGAHACDDCGRTPPVGTPMLAYNYWDLPGPEYVCWDCKDEHDRRDREAGY